MSEAPDLREVGDRLERLLAELRSVLDVRQWEMVEDALAAVTDLYGGGLSRVMDLVSGPDAHRLVGDDLIASLLILHGLHPDSLDQRVRRALDDLRPDMEAHGGNVELLDIDEEAGVIRLRMLGSCDGCPSSSVTLQMAVRDALAGAAPEIEHIELIDDAPPAPPTSTPVTLGATRVGAG